MNDEFENALKAMTPMPRAPSLRAFLAEHAPTIRESMRTTGRPLGDFIPLIRKQLMRAGDPAEGRIISPRSVEVYMSEFAPARMRPLKKDDPDGAGTPGAGSAAISASGSAARGLRGPSAKADASQQTPKLPVTKDRHPGADEPINLPGEKNDAAEKGIEEGDLADGNTDEGDADEQDADAGEGDAGKGGAVDEVSDADPADGVLEDDDGRRARRNSIDAKPRPLV